MVQSDALSRRPDHIPEEDTDNEDLVLLPDELFINLINVELAKMIESAATSDELVKNTVLISPPQSPAGLKGFLRNPQDYTMILMILSCRRKFLASPQDS